MMRATVSVKALKDALNKVSLAVERHSNIQILSMFKFEVSGDRLTISGTDLDIEISASVPALGVEPGSICVPRAIWRLVNALPNWETIAIREADDRRLVVDMPDGRLSLIGMMASDYPDIAGKEQEFRQFSMPSNDLLAAIQRVRPFISTEETRYYLNGIYMHVVDDKLLFVATDCHRLSRLTIDKPPGADFGVAIVPRHTIDHLCNLLPRSADPIRISYSHPGPTRFVFETLDGFLKLTTKLIDGTYPSYERVIPKEATSIVELRRQDWLTKMGRAALLGRNASTLVVRPAMSHISIKNVEIGEMTIALKASLDLGDGFTFGANPNYLASILAAHRAEAITLKFCGSGNPIRFDSEGLLTVLMPLRGDYDPIPLPDGAAP